MLTSLLGCNYSIWPTNWSGLGQVLTNTKAIFRYVRVLLRINSIEKYPIWFVWLLTWVLKIQINIYITIKNIKKLWWMIVAPIVKTHRKYVKWQDILLSYQKTTRELCHVRLCCLEGNPMFLTCQKEYLALKQRKRKYHHYDNTDPEGPQMMLLKMLSGRTFFLLGAWVDTLSFKNSLSSGWPTSPNIIQPPSSS